jgi:hypothetical protein
MPFKPVQTRFALGILAFIAPFLSPNLFADCPQPNPPSAMTLLVTDKESDMFDAKEKAANAGKAPGLLSQALKRLGYTTVKDQEKFALEVKKDSGLDQEPDFKDKTVEAFDYSLYAPPSGNLDFLVLCARAPSFPNYDYYFFRKKGGSYALITRKPVENYSKYCDSYLEYYSFEGKDYVSTVGSGGGTGFLACDAQMYEVGKGSVSKVLDYTASGDCYPSNNIKFTEDFSVGPVSFVRQGLQKSVRIPFTITFCSPARSDAASHEIPALLLFKKTYFMKYNWSLLQQAFVLDPAASGFPAGVSGEGDLFGMDFSEFLQRYPSELEALAQKGDANRKNWLRDFLNDEELKSQEGSAEMKRLKALLGK